MKLPAASACRPLSWSVVSNIDEAQTVTGRKVLLAGASVFASGNDVKPKDYVRIAARQGASFFRSLLTKQVPHVFLAVSEGVMRAAPRGTRFALAIDAYIQWGLGSRGKTIVIGGYEGSRETHLDVLVFEDSRFVAYENKVLPGIEAAHFTDAVTTMLDDLASAHPGCTIVQASPLTPFGKNFPTVQYVGDKIFKRLSFRPLSFQAASRTNNVLVPAGIVGLGILFYAGTLGKGWSDYHGARQAFEQEIADPLVTGQGGVDSGVIDTIQQRRFFLDDPRRQVALSEKLKAVVAGVGKIEGLRIVEIKLPAPSVGSATESIGVPVASSSNEVSDRKPDVWLRVSVPLEGQGAMLQGRSVMQAISTNTGMSVRLARQGWSDDGMRRVFTIEGFIHG